MIERSTARAGWDFFVSYAQPDREWAEWVAWQLEDAGHRVLLQAWDMVAGVNWVDRVDHGAREAARTVVLLSPDYLVRLRSGGVGGSLGGGPDR